MEQIEYQGSARRGAERGPLLACHAVTGAACQQAGLVPGRKQAGAVPAGEVLRGFRVPEKDLRPPESLSGPCWLRVFPGEDRQLAALRRWLASLLPECSARDDVTYVASELAANAVVHTASGRPGGRFAVEVTWSQSMVRVAVADAGAPSGPRVISDPADERGRGLLVVAGLAARTGVRGDQRGRLVWADVPWEDARGPSTASSAQQRTRLCEYFLKQGGLGSMPLTGPMLGTPPVDGQGSAGPPWQPGARSAGGPKAAIAAPAVTTPVPVGGTS